MKINIFSTPSDGRCGIGTYTKYLSEEQEKLGNKLNFFYINPNENNPINLLKIINPITKKCNIVHIQFEYSFFGRALGLTGLWIVFFFPLVYILSHIRECRVATTMHEIWDSHSPPKFGALGSIYTFILNLIIMKCSDTLLVLSENAFQIVKRQGIRVNNLFRIPLGLKIPNIPDRRSSKITLGIDPNSLIILQFGFITETKGQDILVTASSFLPAEYTIIIAGSCKTSQDITYCKSFRNIAPDNVIFQGFIAEKDVPIIFAAADLVILPYRQIAQSAVLNLSLSYEIPTITSDIPFFRDIKNDYNCILLFKSGDPKSLADTIIKILQDKELLYKLKENTRRYLQLNTYHTVALELNKIYKNSGVKNAH